MHFVFFVHSLLSDWNHGNAHFLRGVLAELKARGHRVTAYEPSDAWSLQNLLSEHGAAAVDGFRHAYPSLNSMRYEPGSLDLDTALADADVVIVHEWNAHDLVRQIGQHRADRGRYLLLFHDTHHRAVTDPGAMSAYDLTHYDGVLAFGRVLRDLYLERCWTRRAWIWHEAADVRVFHPQESRTEQADTKAERTEDEATGFSACEGDLVWVGNWGDGERTAELHEFLLGPVKRLGLRANVFGVRYPPEALASLADAGISYRGWLPNYAAPALFANHRVTVHVPRGPYTRALPGIPTIRVFEALACGIPLVSAPWDDAEGLFTPGQDYLIAHNGGEMERHLRALLCDPALAQEQVAHGLKTILSRHTCAHRVDELIAICQDNLQDQTK